MPKGYAPKSVLPLRNSGDIRTLVLRCLHERSMTATSAGRHDESAISVVDLMKTLKASGNVTREEVVEHLAFLTRRGWIVEKRVAKRGLLHADTLVPRATAYYWIATAGIEQMQPNGCTTDDAANALRFG